MAQDLSLLSALSLFTLADLCLVSTSEHTTVVSLQELGGLVKCVHVLLLGLLFDSDDLCKILSSSLLFFAFGPLLANLSKLLLVVFKVGRLIVPLAILFTHVSIVRLQGLRILLIGAIVLRQKLLFLLLVSIFSLFQLLS